MPSFHYKDFAEKNTAFLYIVSRIKICKKKNNKKENNNKKTKKKKKKNVDVLSIANAFDTNHKQKHRMWSFVKYIWFWSLNNLFVV